MNLAWGLIIVAAYGLGSIPFGVVIGRMRGVNLLREGSRNPGASNVTRLLGKRLGMLCFFLDMGKGVIPVIVAGVMFDLLGDRPASSDPTVAVLTRTEMWLWLSVACAAVLGHSRDGGRRGLIRSPRPATRRPSTDYAASFNDAGGARRGVGASWSAKCSPYRERPRMRSATRQPRSAVSTPASTSTR